MKLIYPVFLSYSIVADNSMQTHRLQVLAENEKVQRYFQNSSADNHPLECRKWQRKLSYHPDCSYKHSGTA
jgi:hypothetical protein